MQSLSTSPLVNKQCQKNCKIKGAVCEKCFSITMMKRYHALVKKLERNHAILTTEVIPVEYLPMINCKYFRFEAFGDLENEIQFINYLNICYKNPDVNFAIWTKNPHIMNEVFNEMKYKKPNNLNIIVSSLFLNNVWKIDHLPYAKKYWFIDKIFTVYDSKFINENNIEINCGSKKCLDCLLCYTKNDIKFINEKLK
jgi:hypothetical protein